MVCTSGFMDDVTFGHNGHYAETWRLHRAAMALSSVAIPGRVWCLWMLVWIWLVFYCKWCWLWDRNQRERAQAACDRPSARYSERKTTKNGVTRSLMPWT